MQRSMIERRRSRKGAAPVEFVFFLPLLLILLVAMVACTVLVFRMYEISQRTRYDAWAGTDCDVVEPDPAARFEGGLGKLARVPAWEGLVESRRSEFQPLPRFVSKGGVVLESRFRLLRGSWDHERIAFPDRGRLQVSPHFDVHDGEARRALESLAETLRAAGD